MLIEIYKKKLDAKVLSLPISQAVLQWKEIQIAESANRVVKRFKLNVHQTVMKF